MAYVREVMSDTVSRRAQCAGLNKSKPNMQRALSRFPTAPSLDLSSRVLDTEFEPSDIGGGVAGNIYPVLITNIGRLPYDATESLIVLDTALAYHRSDTEPLTITTIADERNKKSDFDVSIVPDWDLALSELSPKVFEEFSDYIIRGGNACTLALKLDNFELKSCYSHRSRPNTIRDTFSECVETHNVWKTEVEHDGLGYIGKVYADLGSADFKLVYGKGSQYVEHSILTGQRTAVNMTLFFRLRYNGPEDIGSGDYRTSASRHTASSRQPRPTDEGERIRRRRGGNSISDFVGDLSASGQ